MILIRKKTNEFRLLFIDWVAGFDKQHYFWDKRELFNPPVTIRPDPEACQDPTDRNDRDAEE